MKTALILCVLLAGCASTTGVQIDDKERAACAAEGCTVWTERELLQLARKFFREGWDAAAKAAGKGA